MFDAERCLLTTKDYTILEVMLERRLGRDDPLGEILRKKISSAVVMFRDDIPATVVTLNSRVTYRVDDGPAETRIIAHDEMRGLVGMTMPITTRRGLSLLGLAEGETATVARSDGRTETLAVQHVVYQPEAARREASQLRRSSANAISPTPHFLKVVHRSDDLPERQSQRVLVTARPESDDPGPSAA